LEEKIMLEVVSAILGIIGGGIPQILKYFQTKSDYKHETELLKLQMENATLLHGQKIEEVTLEADITEAKAAYEFAKVEVTGNKWLDGFANFITTSVRPAITFGLFGLYIHHKIITQNIAWVEYDQAILTAVIFFWFSGRAVKYAMGQKGG
jgi:hypothetical protein